KLNHLQGATVRQRFDAYVSFGEDCWEWTSYRDPNGYGRLSIDNYPHLAHRLAWEFNRGPIPGGMHVLHRCDNPSCVKPEHLFLGSHDDNMADKMRKKRHRFGVSRGSKHGCSKLTEDQVRRIRLMSGSSREIANALGNIVSSRQIRDIRCGRLW